MAVVLIVATGVSTIAVAILARERNFGALPIVAGAWVLALATGILTAVLVVAALRRRGLRGVIAAVAGVAVGVFGIALVPVVAAIAWQSTPNPAEQQALPLEQTLQSVGATRVCSTGDPGLGPDNVQPWFQAYYRASQLPTLVPRLQRAGDAMGYPVVVQTTSVLPAPATLGGAHGTLSIGVSSKAVSLPCNGGSAGQSFTPADGEVAVSVQLVLPDRPQH